MRSDTDTDAGPAGRIVSPVVDGVVADRVVAPSSGREVADLLADAAARGLAVAPVGAATALGLGNPPARLDVVLSTARLGGVLDYEPTDLVLSVGAGARLGDVRVVLAEHGQGLPLDPPGGNRATIGGLIATGRSGPMRLGAGTLRDLLIGIAVAHPSGTVTKAGGMVVKNVTGFDLARLYHGSLGTLGVIVSANFKVLPLPRAEATVLIAAPTLAAALVAASQVRASSVQPVALDAAWFDGEWLAAVRLVGRSSTVAALANEIEALVGSGTRRLDDRASADWWRVYVEGQRPATGDRDVVVRLDGRPKFTGELAGAVAAAAGDGGHELVGLACSIGLGSVIARVRLADGGTRALALWQGRLLGLADQVTILAAPSAWKSGLDVWGREAEGIDVMRALKRQFDPQGVLNPGRFASGI